MEWRCEWCGKPHDEDDPPCDNCGHGSFERAVVQRTDLADSDPDTTTVWECTACGREHPKNSPPCSRCNNATLERREKRVDESNLTERPGSGDYETVSADSTTLWVCPACGREHTKNAPPCSRCGNATLEREQRRVSDDELTVPGYRDLVTPKYLAALGVVLGLATLLVLGAGGVVDLPGFPDDSVPGVDEVPGNGTVTAGGVSLADIEGQYLDALDTRRADGGTDPLDRRSRLDAVARYYNQRLVKAELASGSLPGEGELRGLLPGDCSGAAIVSLSRPSVENAETAGAGLADSLGGDDTPLRANYRLTGVDIHSADGTLFLTQFVCST
jgi:hypothetical protein